MTHSKSSAGFLAIALLAGLLYRIGWRDGLSRAVLGGHDRGLGLRRPRLRAAGCRRHRQAAGRSRRIHRPRRNLGGGAALYRAIIRCWARALAPSPIPVRQSPLHNYVSGSWVDAVSHGHNGYLQVLVTIGGVGFVLTMLALVAGAARPLLDAGLPGRGRLQADADGAVRLRHPAQFHGVGFPGRRRRQLGGAAAGDRGPEQQRQAPIR